MHQEAKIGTVQGREEATHDLELTFRLNASVVIKAKHFYNFKLITEDFPLMQEPLEKPLKASGEARSQTMPGHRMRF